MNVAVFGGTGFIGSYIVDELLKSGKHPLLLVRPGSENKVFRRNEITLIYGDVHNTDSICEILNGCDAVIYNIGIIRENKAKNINFNALHFEGARRTADLSLEFGVSRFLLMSANGVKPDGTAYQKTKYFAEEYIKSTDIAWTIFRPSVVFGNPRGNTEFCSRLRDEIIRSPLPAPLFFTGLLPKNAGMFETAPVHVKDVASVIVKSLDTDETIGRTISLCGPDRINWKILMKLISKASGKGKLTVPVPVVAVKTAAFFLERFPSFPVTRDQITMLMEGNICDSHEVFELFGIEPIRFSLKNLDYLKND